LTKLLIGELYGDDLNWLKDGEPEGLPAQTYEPRPNRGLTGQRGGHWPIPYPGFPAN